MAVRAPHVALRDLVQQCAPRGSIQHRPDSVDLIGPIAMIELEHDGVDLAAVNAWMRL